MQHVLRSARSRRSVIPLTVGFLFTLATAPLAYAETSGAVDTTFVDNLGAGPVNADAPAITPAGLAYVTAERSDGQILVGGLFKNWDGTNDRYLALLESGGSLDTSITGAAGHAVIAMVLQADGKIVLTGSFRTWGGTKTERLARLNSDGTLDSTFATNVGNGYSNTAYAVALQSDGKILGGNSESLWNSVDVGSLVRLNADGTRDTSFDTSGGGANGRTRAIAVQSDSSIIAGGSLADWNGTMVGRLVRMDSTGTIDAAFNSNIGNGAADGDVYGISLLSDGSMMIGGDFDTWDTTTGVGRLVKLDSSGVRDASFSENVGAGANARVRKIFPLSTGGFLVVGEFTTWNGQSVGRVVALNGDGTVNEDATNSLGLGADNKVYGVTELSNGDLLIAGSFTTWDATAAPGLVRISALSAGSGGSSGGIDSSSDVSGGVPPVMQQFALSEEDAVDPDACARQAPDHVVDSRAKAEQRTDGWFVSYAAWPNDGAGGWVCSRTLTYQAATDTWLTTNSMITGSGIIQEYAIPAAISAARTTDGALSPFRARAEYCRGNAPDLDEFGATWGQRNEGWAPSYAAWVNEGSGGWVCARVL